MRTHSSDGKDIRLTPAFSALPGNLYSSCKPFPAVEKDGRWFLIGNLYGQNDYGRKKMVYTDYDALEKAMGEIRGSE